MTIDALCSSFPEGRFTLIGTTDIAFSGDPGSVATSYDETAYLCRVVSRYFAKPVTPADVVWSYAGVRPLYDDGSARASEVTRDFSISRHRGMPRRFCRCSVARSPRSADWPSTLWTS
jgi:glycerol-3-phosphate dehydrogenase